MLFLLIHFRLRLKLNVINLSDIKCIHVNQAVLDPSHKSNQFSKFSFWWTCASPSPASIMYVIQCKLIMKKNIQSNIKSYLILINLIHINHNKMDIKTYNKALNSLLVKGLNHAFVKEIDPTDEQQAFCNDTDTVQYKSVAKKNSLSLYFTIVDIDIIWNYIQGYFRKTYYNGFKINMVTLGGVKWLQITIDNEGLTNFMKTFKESEEVGVTSGRKKFDAVFEVLGKKFSSIKRHFTASPFEIMLQAIQANQNKGNATVESICFYTKHHQKQKTWLAFQKNQFTVYYGISFDDRSEQKLADIFFSELIDAKKHVHNAPAVTVSESQLPKFLIDSFPKEKTQKYAFSNGIVALTIFGNLLKNPRSMATYLAGFRTYAYYHIQASKCYLHSRVLRRINAFHKDLTNAKIESFAQK